MVYRVVKKHYGLQSEGPPRDEHNSDTKRGVASAMKPPDQKTN